MKQYTILEVKKVLLDICEVCLLEQERLTEIDSKLGDGDMGISMSKGAEAVQREIEQAGIEEWDITKLLFNCGMAFNRAAPSTLGTLLSFGFIAIGMQLNHCEEISEESVVAFPGILADTIASRGKAKVGDKTILDALYPYAVAMKHTYQESKSLKESLVAGAKAAEEGMERTKGIKAKIGRASWLNTRNMEYPDAGCVLCLLVSRKLAQLS